jgi:hypothetical protein
MKKILSFTVFVFALLVGGNVQAQKFAPIDKSPMDLVTFPRKNPVVEVVYSRPQLKGRTVESLIPDGKVWRTGANEATEITFNRDVVFGGKEVKAGTYTLFSMAQGESFTLILNSDLGQWGAYNYNPDHDVVRVPASLTMSNEALEAFSMTFDGDENNMTLYMGWGNWIASVSIK